MNIIKHPDTSNTIYQNLWKTIETGSEWKGELQNKHKNGTFYWVEQTIIPVKDENASINSYISVAVDISAKKEIEFISAIDQLTGVLNRRKLDEYLAQEVEASKRYNRPLSLLMIDIDHFKKINDTYGHQIGDYALQKVTNILKENIRTSDYIGRFGGEEFMVICPETTSDSALSVAEKLRSAIETYSFETITHLSISIGVASIDNSDSVVTWIEKADKALYNAKASGRNCVASKC